MTGTPTGPAPASPKNSPREGVHVRLAVNGICAAVNTQNYIRDELNARLFKAGVEVLPWMRLYGADGRTAYFIHTASREAVVLEDVDTLDRLHSQSSGRRIGGNNP